MSTKPDLRTYFGGLQPTERLFAIEERFYREALIPRRAHFTVQDIAKGILRIGPATFPAFQTEIADMQQQIRKLTPQLASTPTTPNPDIDRQLAFLIRKDANNDPGRQYMLETLVGITCGIPVGPTIPSILTPEMLAYYYSLREREQQGIRRKQHVIPYKSQAVVTINALEATLALPQETFVDRFRHLYRATQAVAMVLRGPDHIEQVNSDMYAHLKGAVTGRVAKHVLNSFLPPHTRSYAPLLEMDRDMATDGVIIHTDTDTIIATTQTKSSPSTIPRGTQYGTKGQDSLDWTHTVGQVSYRDDKAGSIFLAPVLIARNTPTGPRIELKNFPTYPATFSPIGEWTNRFKPSIKELELRFLSARRSVESSWQLWQGAIPYIAFHPEGITAIFGVVAYGELERWHIAENHSYADKMRHLIDACYETVG